MRFKLLTVALVLATISLDALSITFPDPTQRVTWGDQRWEEMMYTSITFYNPPVTQTAAGQK